jgi:aminopeptidase N
MTTLDALIPAPDAVERHETLVRAPAARVWEALHTTDLGRAPLVRVLMALRALPARRGGTRPPAPARRTLAALDALGFGRVAETPGREVVFGLEGPFWQPGCRPRPADAARFREPVPPGTARAAWDFVVEPAPGGRTRLATETRVVCADARSRRRFRAYWLVVRPFSGLIRRSLLRTIRRAAEAGLAVALLAGCRAPEPPAPGRVPGVDVTAYGVALRLDPATLRLDGHVRLRLRRVPAGDGPEAGGAPADTLALALDRAMRVRAVRVDGRPAAFTHAGGVLRVPLASAAGGATVEVVYGGTPEGGLYAGQAAGQRVVFTDGWPQRGAGWLPAVHHPADPAALALAVEVPAGWEVAAAGVPEGVTPVPGGYRRWRFTLGQDAPAYTFAFAAADFAVVEDSSGGVPVRHVLLAADSAQGGRLARVPAVLDTLAALLGPYPYRAFATVEVPLGFAGMENAAAPFLQAALYRGSGGGLEAVAIHEAVHQWMGNRLGPADWRDLWLAEGAATYLTTVVYERLDGPDVARRQRVDMARMGDRDARRPLFRPRLDRPADALSTTVYNKGGAVFHLLRLKLGDRAFYDALRTLVARGRPTSTARFRRTLEAASGQDLGPIFRYWVRGTDIPALRTTWDAGRHTLRWRVEGDGGTLAGLPVELRLRQGGAEHVVDLRAGRALLPGAERPVVEPVGVVLAVD